MSYSREYYGVQVMLHHREDFAGKTLHRIISRTGFDTVIQIEPNVVVTAADVRGMDLEQRGCLFDGEVGIYFKHFDDPLLISLEFSNISSVHC